MSRLPRSFYAGVFLLSIGMLAAQFLLTRILSVVFWYHFVFMIVSMVMFGLTLGTLIVYFLPNIFTSEKTVQHIRIWTAVSGVAVLVAFLSLFYLPGEMDRLWKMPMATMVNWFFPILVIPFIFMGMTFSLILTRFPQNIGRIYGVNLVGSASGCLVAYAALNTFTGPAALFLLAALFLIAAVCFAAGHSEFNPWRRRALLSMIGILVLTAMFIQQTDFIQMAWVKNHRVGKPFYSKWNFFSHVAIRKAAFHPFGWGYSPKIWGKPLNIREDMILIDEGAGTVLTRFDNLSDLYYLNMDSGSLAYRVRQVRSALVIGSGGGRDLFTAILNGAQKVVGVEINKDVMEIAYSVGMIQKFPQIEIHNDDGRSFVARSKDHYDLIQASLVDSFAAASNGAFALSENSLYTSDAWDTYLQHLTAGGILTFSRWHHKQPSEVYRLLTMTKRALRNIGLTDYRRHILLARVNGGGGAWPDVGTILVSKTPFTDEEIQRFQKVCDDLEFEVILTKDKSANPVFDKIFEREGDSYAFATVKGNIDPPTDNKPFYFYFSDLSHFFKGLAKDDQEGPRILRNVTILVVILAVFFSLITLILTLVTKGHDKILAAPSLYFSLIGLAFMFIEIPLIQRLGIFLGHPVYGLTVVLFGLLLACGLGSMNSSRITSVADFRKIGRMLLGFIALLAFIWPGMLETAAGAGMPYKIFLSFLAVCSVGFLMGFPFPFAAAQVSANPKAPLIFYWAVNGFTSMCASAFATVILINLGYVWAMMIGFAFYALAFSLASRLKPVSVSSA